MVFLTGSFPSKLKSAIVTPLIKKPNLNCEILKYYRPVSNLLFLSKVIKKVISSPFLKHMKDNNLLDTLQSTTKKHTVLKQHFFENRMTFFH